MKVLRGFLALTIILSLVLVALPVNAQPALAATIGITNQMVYLGSNVNAPFIFNDARLRMALSLAMNRDYLATLVPNSQKVISIVAPGSGNPDINLSYNAALADTLLSESGYPNGFTADLYTTSEWTDLANAISQEFSIPAINITLHVNILEQASFDTQLQAGSLNFFLTDTAINPVIPEETLGRLLLTDGVENFTGYSNSNFDAAFNAGNYLGAETIAFTVSGQAGFAIAPLVANITPEKPGKNIGAVKANLYTVTGPPLAPPGPTVGSVGVNTTGSKKLNVQVNVKNVPNLVDYDVAVILFTKPASPAVPPVPIPSGQYFFSDILNSDSEGCGNVHLLVNIPSSYTENAITVMVNVGETLSSAPASVEYGTGFIWDVPLK